LRHIKEENYMDNYRLSGRDAHPEDSIFNIAGRTIGGGNFAVIAGPCSVETEEQIVSIAREVKALGASFLRGGAFKPRTSPYSFSGLGTDGLELLKIARAETGLPIVTEIISEAHIETFSQSADIIQIGARNMQNFSLLKEVGRLNKPVLLKRGLSSTIDELLMAAEHIMSAGAEQVILCERGIRTFETKTRNTLDLSAVPVLKKLSHLPVIVDPSHATGDRSLVEPMSLAAAACGADGLIIEVHNHPDCAMCDGEQSVTPSMFGRIVERVNAVRAALY
jgi:3-deoxy-7-phosphoheptulonate synthase